MPRSPARSRRSAAPTSDTVGGQAVRAHVAGLGGVVTEVAATGFAIVSWAAVGPEGEAQLAKSGVTVRCLQRPDGALAMSDDEPDLVAVVGRAY
jgi:prolyl-tRNA synthetase